MKSERNDFMDKGICVEIENSVILSTEEYRRLVTAQAYLNVIAEAVKNHYSMTAVVEVISLLVEPVRTENANSSDDRKGETSC